jgi:(p)ppGpp synthase/HD superfamily hydrolase
MGVNIEGLNVEEHKNLLKSLNFIITVTDTYMLSQVFTEIKKLKFVRSVTRHI